MRCFFRYRPCWLLYLIVTIDAFSAGFSTATTSATTAETGATCGSSALLSKAPSVLDLASLTSKPVVYTIAGSDSGGGAGIQADLQAISRLGGHGCSAITCLTAQNSVGVSGVHAAGDFLQAQLDALMQDLPPMAVKIGMLGTKQLTDQVGAFVQSLRQQPRHVWVVLDPVMISTSGHRLIQEDAQQAMVQKLFPYVDLITPNKYEAEALLGRPLDSTADVEQGARDLLAMGARAVLIKGGHTQENSTFAQDYFVSTDPLPQEPRNCDGGVWLRSVRLDTEHTHGTGCSLSSALATALALQSTGWPTVTNLVDATTLAKAYVTAGIAAGVGLGQGAGPVAHTLFPQSDQHFPRIVSNPNDDTPVTFPTVSLSKGLGKLLILVDSLEWVQKLVDVQGVTDIQLRIKGQTDFDAIVEVVKKANEQCQRAGIRLWINDYWQAAIKAGVFGVHMGQEDLYRCQRQGGLEELRKAGLALGLSTHSYGELAAALAVNPSYISLGPIYGTSSKQVNFGPQGLAMVQQWRRLIPSYVPLVVIGGISDASRAADVCEAGADCVAVIGAVTQASDPQEAVEQLLAAVASA